MAARTETKTKSPIDSEVPIENRLPEVRSAFDVTRANYKDFDDDMVNLVRTSIMPAGSSNAETYFLLQLAATYRLDPFAREIWAAKMKGKDGEGGKVAILVGRDGMLSIAERHKSFRGFRCQSVYANDDFEYLEKPRKMPDGTFSSVKHKFKLVDRGELLGAWAEIYRVGRPSVFFFAPMDEYMPKSERKLEYSPWGTTFSVMIQKCALATGLRIAFRITGLYIEEEMVNAMAIAGQSDTVYDEPNWPEDSSLEGWLRQLFDAAEEAKPGSWLPGKVSAALEACGGEEDYAELEKRLTAFILQHGGTIPEQIEVVDGEFTVVEPLEGDEDIPFGEEADAAGAEDGEAEQQTLESES